MYIIQFFAFDIEISHARFAIVNINFIRHYSHIQYKYTGPVGMHSVYDCSNCFSGDCSNTMTKRADDGQSTSFNHVSHLCVVHWSNRFKNIFKNWRTTHVPLLKIQYMYINKTFSLCRRVFV